MSAQPDQSVFSIETLRALLMGDEALVARVAGECLRVTPELQARLMQAVQTNGWSELAAAAHELRGMASNMGAKQLAQTASELEAAAHAQRADDVAALQVPLLQQWTSVVMALSPFDGATAEPGDNRP